MSSSFSLYDTSIGFMIQGVTALIDILKKASEHPDAASFPATSLYEDMKPLTFQIQVATNIAKNTVRDLGIEDAGVLEDKEVTMDDMIARCEKVLKLLKSVDPKSLENQDVNAMITTTMGPSSSKVDLTVQEFVLGFALPNFFFHVTTTYNVLRMKGVPLGKMDYLTPFVPFINRLNQK